MESAIRKYSICVALVTFLPPVLTQLIWTKGVAMRSARDRSVSWQRRDVMFALSLAPSQRCVHQSGTFVCENKTSSMPLPCFFAWCVGPFSLCWCRGSVFLWFFSSQFSTHLQRLPLDV